MPYKVKPSVWLSEESERVKKLLLMPRLQGRAWTDQSLRAELREIGLAYTPPEIKAISDKLLADGLVESVAEEPAPV